MQIIMDVPATITPPVNQTEAQHVAREYVISQIDPALLVSERAAYHRANDTWRLLICCKYGSLYTIEVEAQTGNIIPLTEVQIGLVRERLAMAAARSHHVLPRDQHGYVLAEYARRRASWYLDANLSLFFSAADPVFVPSDPPIWQMTIIFKMYNIGPLTLGVMDVDAQTGEPVPLTDEELTRTRERTSAIIRCQTSTTESS